MLPKLSLLKKEKSRETIMGHVKRHKRHVAFGIQYKVAGCLERALLAFKRPATAV